MEAHAAGGPRVQDERGINGAEQPQSNAKPKRQDAVTSTQPVQQLHACEATGKGRGDDSENLPPHELASIVIVLRMPDNHDFSTAPFQRFLVAPLLRAGLQVDAFEGVRDMKNQCRLFLRISASVERLLREAERVQMPLLLSASALGKADVAVNEQLIAERAVTFAERPGGPEPSDLHIPTVPASMWGWRREGLDPYFYMWSRYVPDATTQHLWHRYSSTKAILSQPQAIKLLLSIIMAPSDAHNGADVRLDELRIQKKILTWFPTHDYAQLNDIVARWSSVRTLWDAPVGDVSRYFGERVGFYFGFLEHYVHWLWVPALVGVIIYIQDQANKPSSGYLLFVGFAMAIWSTLFMETWKRKQRYFALKWGTTEYLKYEPVRPEFEANARRVRSFVDGKPSFAFDPIRFRARFTVSMMMTLTLLGVVAVAAISIFWLRVVLNRSSKSRGGSIPDGWPNHITSIINALQIQVMKGFYTKLAVWMTNFENHASGSEYDRSLIVKMALFQCINAYFNLVYIAFIKNHVTINGDRQQCDVNVFGEPDCMSELESQILILMLVRLVLGNAKELLVPFLKGAFRLLRAKCLLCMHRVNKKQVKEMKAALEQSPIEKEADVPVYDVFKDYLEIMLQYGFVTLFAVAFQLAPLIAYVSCIVEMYVDRKKMLRLSSRPVPASAQDIGAWFRVFEAFSYIAPGFNMAIVLFTYRGTFFGNDLDLFGRLLVFVIAERVLLFIKYAIATFIPDEPYRVQLQLKRKRYLVNKHINHARDVVPKPASADAASPEVSNSVPPPPSAGAPGPHATAPSMPAVEPQEVKMAWHDGRVIQLLPSWRALQQVDAVVWGGGEPAAPAPGGGEPGALHGPANAAGAAVGSAQPPSHVALGISQAGSTNDTDGGAGVLAPAQAAAGSSASSGAPLTRARSHSVTSHGSDVSAGSSSSGAKRRRKKEKKEKKKRKKVARERAYVDAVAAASMQASAAAGAYGAGINTLYMPALAPGGYAVPGAAYVPPAAFAAYAPPAAGVAGASAGAGGSYPAPPRYDASGAAYMQPPVNIAR